MPEASALPLERLPSRTFGAIAAFVDLAGFTAAAEAFSRSGAQGTERLVQLINRLFTPAISMIETAGGEIGWFAGDAMGVLFDQSHTAFDQAVDAVARASRCIAALAPVDVDGQLVRLDAKVGIAAGPIRWESIPGDQITTWFGGEAIDLSVVAEHHAVPGDVILHESVARHVGELGGEAIEPGYFRFRATEIPDSGDRYPRVESPMRERRNPRYQPPKIARLSAFEGSRSRIAEHRPVTVFFAAMPKASHDPAELLVLRTVVEQQGGVLNGVTEGDKGAVVMAAFGAPTSHPERADRALHAACEVRNLFPGVRIGVTSGRVFAGPVGSADRWDYSTIGDRVNVAARLMQAAGPGEVLVDRATIGESRRRVAVGEQRALELKGKSTNEIAVPILSIGSRDQSVLLGASRTSFVGRDADVAALVSALEGDEALIVIRGDAGSGKSRLVDHLVGLRPSGQFVISWLEQADVGRPFQLWRRLFTRLAGPDGDVLAALTPERRNDPRLPVANTILGVDLVESVVTTTLASTERFEVLVSVVEDLLGELIVGRDVVIEDLHWADDESLELLRRVAPRLYGSGLHLLAPTRPDPRVDSLTDAGIVHNLGDLEVGALTELAVDRWVSAFGREPQTALVDTLVERGAGSPLFVEQLVELAHDVGVDPGGEAWPSEVEIPANLTDVVLGRLDRLPDVAGTVAELASVLGRTFSSDDLLGSFGHSYDVDVLIGGLDLLVDSGFVVFGTPNHFHHALFAEAAYERMAFGERGLLHRDVLLHLERVHPDPAPFANDMARHAEQVDDDDERKRKYFMLAGEEAMRTYSLATGIEWFSKVRSLIDDSARGTLNAKLGRLHLWKGEYGLAADALGGSLSSLTGDEFTVAQFDYADALIRDGRSREGFSILDALSDTLASAKDWTNLRTAMNYIGRGSAMLEDVDRLTALERRWQDLAAHTDTASEFNEELEWLIPLHRMRGDITTAQRMLHEKRDQQLARGDLFRAANLTADVAGYAFMMRDIGGALRELRVAAELMERVGNRADRITFVSLNDVLLREEIGDTEGARALAAATLSDALRVGLRIVHAHLARVIGALENDRRWLHRSVLLAEEIGHRGMLLDAVACLGELDLRNGLLLEALDAFSAVSSHRKLSVHHQLLVLRSEFELDRFGRTDAGRRLGNMLGETDDPLDRAQILALRAELDGSPALLSEAIDKCVQAFNDAPSATVSEWHRRLTGERLVVSPALLSPVAFRSDISMDELGLRLDRITGVSPDDAKRRCAEIVSNLRTAATDTA